MNRSRKRSSHKRNRLGATTIEFALVAPFLFFLVFASVEFSRMMMVRQALTNAAREGCRHAALVTTQNTSTSKTLVLDKLQPVIQEEPAIRVSFTPSNVSALPPGTRITAVVEVDCADVSWMPPMLFGGAKIRATSSMTKE
jgi:hypothetical protein